MAQHAPTKATSRKIDDEGPNPMRAEAIAMRRIVVEMGYWLSPFMRDTPLPVLSEWERTVNLQTLDHNCKTRARQHDRAQTSERVLATVDKHRKPNVARHRNLTTATVVDVQIARTKTPATRDTLQARVKLSDAMAAAIDLGKTITVQVPRFGMSAGKAYLVTGIRTDLRNNTFDLTLWG